MLSMLVYITKPQRTWDVLDQSNPAGRILRCDTESTYIRRTDNYRLTTSPLLKNDDSCKSNAELRIAAFDTLAYFLE